MLQKSIINQTLDDFPLKLETHVIENVTHKIVYRGVWYNS